MDIMDIVLRWMHILPAIAMVGGTLFMRFAYEPALATLEAQQREKYETSVYARWSKVVMFCTLLLLTSGLVNFIRVFKADLVPTKDYHMAFGLKFILAFGVFFISAKLTGRSDGAKRFREKASYWLTINAGLAIFVVCLGGIMRGVERKPREDKPAPTPTSQVLEIQNDTHI